MKKAFGQYNLASLSSQVSGGRDLSIPWGLVGGVGGVSGKPRIRRNPGRPVGTRVSSSCCCQLTSTAAAAVALITLKQNLRHPSRQDLMCIQYFHFFIFCELHSRADASCFPESFCHLTSIHSGIFDLFLAVRYNILVGEVTSEAFLFCLCCVLISPPDAENKNRSIKSLSRREAARLLNYFSETNVSEAEQ